MRRWLEICGCAAVLCGGWKIAPVHAQSPPTPRFEEHTIWEKNEQGLWPYHVPGIFVTAQGTVLAWADARYDDPGDFGPHHMVLKRSTDGGRTFGPNLYLGRSDNKEIFLFGNAVQPRGQARIYFFYTQKDPRDIHRRTFVFVRHSDDEGAAWSQPVEITQKLAAADRRLQQQLRAGEAGEAFAGDDPELYGREQFYTGPGSIIQLRDDHPTAPGRILVPVLMIRDRNADRAKNPLARGQGNMVLYSDDRGQSWHAGGIVPMNRMVLSEPSLVELSDGTVLLNARVEHQDFRALARSTDGGLSWSKPHIDDSGLPRYWETHSGLLRVPGEGGGGGGRNLILFSFPNAKTRHNLSVFASPDDHRSWPVRKVIHPENSYYSNMAYHDGEIYLIYGKGGRHPWMPDRTVLAKFNLAWLLDETADAQGNAP